MGVISIKTLDINSQPLEIDNDIEKGFLKGSIWSNLYIPYKYKIDKISFDNDYERAIYMLEVYTFFGVELTLYICTHPNNKEALDMLQKINSERKKICEFIETRFKSLTASSDIQNGYFKLKFPWSDGNVEVWKAFRISC